MNPKDIHRYEQAQEDVKRNFCPMLFSFYQGCVDSGFNNTQAFRLTNSYMISIITKPPIISLDENIEPPEFNE